MSSKVTSSSIVFLLLTVFAVGVAFIFRHPLLIYTAVFLVTTNIVLFAWAQHSLRGLTVVRKLPRLAVAGHPTEVQLELENHAGAARFGLLGYELHSQLTPGQDYSPVAFLSAQPNAAALGSYTITPVRSGVFPLGPFYLYGGDPFGFYKSWRKVADIAELTVLPNPVSFRMSRQYSASLLAMDELETVAVPGDSTEFLGVREYQSGEPLKRVHWASTARLGRLISRQYELNVSAAISVLLISDPTLQLGTFADNPLEYSLRMIAGLARGTIQDSYHLSYLGVAGTDTMALSGSGYNFYQQLAMLLARRRATERPDWENASRYILHYLPQRSQLIVFIGELDEEARMRLRQLAVHFAGLSVVTFRRRSFERSQRPEQPGPRLSLGEGYVVHEIGFRDDLAAALGQVLARTSLAGGQR